MKLQANNPIYKALEEAFKAVGRQSTKEETVKQMMEYCHTHYPKVMPRVFVGGPGYGNGARSYLRSIDVKFDEDRPAPFLNPFTRKLESGAQPEMLIEAGTEEADEGPEQASEAALKHLKEQAQRLHTMLRPGVSKQSALAASKALSSAIDALTFQ